MDELDIKSQVALQIGHLVIANIEKAAELSNKTKQIKELEAHIEELSTKLPIAEGVSGKDDNDTDLVSR